MKKDCLFAGVKLAGLLLCALAFLGAESEVLSAPQYAKVATSVGEIWIELNEEKAPLSVGQFRKFVEEKVYEKSSFHGLTEDSLMGGKPGPECGKRSGSGNFSSKEAPVGEFELDAGIGAVGFGRTVGSCNPQKTNNSTQFFIQFKGDPAPQKDFTVFGKVLRGREVAERIVEHLSRPKAEPVSFSITLEEKLPGEKEGG